MRVINFKVDYKSQAWDVADFFIGVLEELGIKVENKTENGRNWDEWEITLPDKKEQT